MGVDYLISFSTVRKKLSGKEQKSSLLRPNIFPIKSYWPSSIRYYITIDSAKDFLADQITADDFSFAFMGIYEGINGEVAQMEKDESLELTNFLKTNQSELDGLDGLLSQIYGTCDAFGHVIYDEKELKDCAQILLLKLQ